ncbi:protein-L-isoaspartate O-methyltransferase [Hyphomicrobium sp.]|mgnify:CR=1 FL=1|uniref:protein-L-isoaspartate O-methyltransferase family protein n=1 Tax=Hyphomicrobium sp. TaxID=82 RepID=UPI000FAD3FAF|nr:protein-L-isoaspartate O-methyltransferase [Hyphomicrobium sp.]RUO97941.1 MAG: protein-L-isoaspartate O-methyltransferase [Hyphomicrobium sp.]
MADTVLQRKNMVESQIRPSDVTDRRITAAMTSIPREAFLPKQLASIAYSDESLTLGPGREVLSPRVLAKLIQLAAFEATDSVLVVSAAGYAAAVVAEMVGKVTALLPDQESATIAGSGFAASALSNAVAVTGPSEAGWAAQAPYDVILIEGGVEQIPDTLKSQVRENGRIVAIATNDKIGRAVELHKRGDVFARREGFQAAAKTVSGFTETKPAFVF